MIESMERDDRIRDPLELEHCYREGAFERALAHLHHELLAPELPRNPWPDLPEGLPDPRDERPWTRSAEDAYFARENAAAVRELAESKILREQLPALCRRDDEMRVDPFRRYHDTWRAEEALAKLQNRPPCVPIIRFDGPIECMGFFNPHEYRIGINAFLFAFDNPRYLLKAYLHEARHAFQFHAIRNPEAHPDVHPSTIVEWTRASETYVRVGPDRTPAEFQAYKNCKLETDARAAVERKEKQIDRE